MITVLQKGSYKLIETKNHTKVLTLGEADFTWVVAEGINEILMTSHTPHKTDCILARGSYRLYDVEDEPHLSDHQHLELNAGDGLWQGYILPHGLPAGHKQRGRIIATNEVISARQLTGSYIGDL